MTVSRPLRYSVTTVVMIALLSACASNRNDGVLLEQTRGNQFHHSEMIELGQLVVLAYEVFDEVKGATVANPPFPTSFVQGFNPIANLQAKDSGASSDVEFYGHLSRRESEPESLVISIRGTSDAAEWIDDIKVAPVQFSDNADLGHVEDGFKSVYETFQVTIPGTESPVDLNQYLAELTSIQKITVVGHSLGSSLATLLAFNAIQSNFASQVELVTFASPRTGNQTFVSALESQIHRSLRFVNEPDLVPKVPPKLLGYRHIDHEVELNSHDHDGIKRSIVCYHNIQTYLYMLDPEINLADECRENPAP